MVKYYENGKVLKLVHAGGFIEIHQNPITAHEVMKKNPRHFVTHPDVFRFPWIVVRPESVLNPGGVFYIVPIHTIHRLLQRNRYQYRDSLFLQQVSVDPSVEVTYLHQLLKQCSDVSETRSKIDFKIEELPEDAIFPKCSFDLCHNQESLIKSRVELEHFDDSPKKSYPVDHWHTDFDYKNNQESKQQAPEKTRTAFSLDILSSDAYIQGAFPKVDGGLEPNCFLQDKALKSCLKKNKNARSRGFRVKFALPGDDDEKIKVKSLSFNKRSLHSFVTCISQILQ